MKRTAKEEQMGYGKPARLILRLSGYAYPDILVLVHRGRRSIRPKCASQFTLGAVRTTNQSQAPALARADAGEGLAAVTGGTAL